MQQNVNVLQQYAATDRCSRIKISVFYCGAYCLAQVPWRISLSAANKSDLSKSILCFSFFFSYNRFASFVSGVSVSVGHNCDIGLSSLGFFFERLYNLY